jgi:hypothetical protein
MRGPKRPQQRKKVAKGRKRLKRAAGAPRIAAGAGIFIVNIIPKSLSFESNQDSEPMLAVNPANPDQLVATAFTHDPSGGILAPYFISTDGGRTWALNTVVPGGDVTGDITVAFSGTGQKLYAGILRQDSPDPLITRMNILATDDFASPTPMKVLDDRLQPDQPFALAVTVGDGPNAGRERVYIGSNDFAGQPQTATVDVSLDAGAAAPVFTKVRIEHRSTGAAGQDGPQVRTAVHADGTVYAAFYGWRTQSGDWEANTLRVTADVVVVRDDQWGGGTPPFAALIDVGDGAVGQRVAQGVNFSFNRRGIPANGQQRLGGTLTIAVDPRPNQSGTVYLAWGSDEPGTGFTIHVRRSTNRGIIWSPSDLLTVSHGTNAALAITTNGVVGLLYQQLVGTGAQQQWETHFRQSTDGTTWSDVILATAPANDPSKDFDPYLGDYDHLLAVGKDFYGIFSASNVPDLAHFPLGVTFQRNADFNRRELLDLDNASHVKASIDPFFFKLSG